MTPRNNIKALLYGSMVFLTSVVFAGQFESNITPSFSETGRMWLFLQPENLSPQELDARLEDAAARLTPRSRARRSKSLGSPPIRLCDLPPSPERLGAIEATGCRVIRVVRYVNAVVVEGNESSLNNANRLDFIAEIKPVLAFAAIPPVDSPIPSIRISDVSDYGASLTQNLLVNIPAVHDLGYRGRGILIGVQDTGFETRRHRCFRSIELIASYDFVNGDPYVFDEDDFGSATHGTRVLSVIAGLDSGSFIGVAPDAQFVLTKTENSESETPIEEDIWVEGLWFHDSLGVDVLSSSLSYRAWHDYSDYDGRTAVTSRAADSALAAGLVIVNSMGNTGLAGYPENKLGAPADARGVISVGGVNRDSSRWQSSSQGPTYDGRIKPNVVAQSSMVFAASTTDNSSYSGRSGTSYSTPIVAGVVALILQANSELTPEQVMDILHRTSSQSDAPDTLTGYGIVNALLAVRLAEAMTAPLEKPPGTFALFAIFPNPTNSRATILRFGLEGYPLNIVDSNGKMLNKNITGANLDLGSYPAGNYWVGTNNVGWRKLVLIR